MKLSVVFVVILALASCGGGDLTVLSQDELPSDLYSSVSPTPAPVPVSRAVKIFLVRADRLVETAAVREASGNPLEESLGVLLKGPGPAETAAGLSSAIPPGVQLLTASVNGGVATVNLSAEFEAAAEERVLNLRVAQVVYTSTALPEVERVRFRVEGEPVDVLAGTEGDAEEGVGRADFPQFTPAEPG